MSPADFAFRIAAEQAGQLADAGFSGKLAE